MNIQARLWQSAELVESQGSISDAKARRRSPAGMWENRPNASGKDVAMEWLDALSGVQIGVAW
jgi:hypothetical protein